MISFQSKLTNFGRFLFNGSQTLLETNSQLDPENRRNPKKKRNDRLPRIHFQRKCSFQGYKWPYTWGFTWFVPLLEGAVSSRNWDPVVSSSALRAVRSPIPRICCCFFHLRVVHKSLCTRSFLASGFVGGEPCEKGIYPLKYPHDTVDGSEILLTS